MYQYSSNQRLSLRFRRVARCRRNIRELHGGPAFQDMFSGEEGIINYIFIV